MPPHRRLHHRLGKGAAAVCLAASLALAAVPADAPAGTPHPLSGLSATLSHLAPGLDSRVVERALEAAWSARARGVDVHSELLTVIDYSLPSWRPRLWVFDLEARSLLFTDRVAHGQGTGEAWARAFSNVPGSKQTSLGLFLTGETYVGRNGYSLRLHGLDPGVNDNAFERAVVMHGAPYVSEAFVRAEGRIGRSWGCPAVSEPLARPLLDTIKGGSLVYAFHADAGAP